MHTKPTTCSAGGTGAESAQPHRTRSLLKQRRKMDTFDTFLRILLDPEDEDLEPLLNSSSTDITPSPPPISPPKRNTLPTADNPFDEGHPIHIQMTLYTEFPSISQTLPAPCTDKVPSQPVFFGAAILSEEPLVSIPCKVTPKLWPSVCHVPLDGREIVHRGKYNIVPFDTEKMELVTVPKHVNELPEGRKLVVGGRDRDGEELYHAVGVYHNLRIPGKVSRSLANMGFCKVSYCHKEYSCTSYEVLCWK